MEAPVSLGLQRHLQCRGELLLSLIDRENIGRAVVLIHVDLAVEVLHTAVDVEVCLVSGIGVAEPLLSGEALVGAGAIDIGSHHLTCLGVLRGVGEGSLIHTVGIR